MQIPPTSSLNFLYAKICSATKRKTKNSRSDVSKSPSQLEEASFKMKFYSWSDTDLVIALSISKIGSMITASISKYYRPKRTPVRWKLQLLFLVLAATVCAWNCFLCSRPGSSLLATSIDIMSAIPFLSEEISKTLIIKNKWFLILQEWNRQLRKIRTNLWLRKTTSNAYSSISFTSDVAESEKILLSLRKLLQSPVTEIVECYIFKTPSQLFVSISKNMVAQWAWSKAPLEYLWVIVSLFWLSFYSFSSLKRCPIGE